VDFICDLDHWPLDVSAVWSEVPLDSLDCCYTYALASSFSISCVLRCLQAIPDQFLSYRIKKLEVC
jgi:hypothetical protein